MQDSIEKLQAFLASADDRMQSLQTQFQSHYDPLVRERDELAEKLKQEETVAQKMERELIGQYIETPFESHYTQ